MKMKRKTLEDLLPNEELGQRVKALLYRGQPYWENIQIKLINRLKPVDQTS
jgi:hypothetical protein